ncbi:MAG: hypothetical protein ACOYM2_14195 [Rectinemataceae bacterium]
MKKIARVLMLASMTTLVGCQQFFSSSLLTFLKRPQAKITTLTATSSAALVLALQSNPDPALAAASLGAFDKLIKSDPTNMDVLKDAAAVAVIASGLDTTMTKALTTLDLTSVMAGTLPSAEQLTTIGNSIVEAMASLDSSGASGIFEALAQSASTPEGVQNLKDSGVGSQTLVMAAAAVALSDISSQNPGIDLSQVISGTLPEGTVVNPPSDAAKQELANLASGITAIDPSNQLLGMLQGMLKF